MNLEDGHADHRGIGFFLRGGVADRDTNPIRWTISGGIAGRGLLPAREADTFGLGLFYNDLQSSRRTGVTAIEDDSQGLEVFYNAALTGATGLTFDIQILDPLLARRTTAVVLGLRLSIRL